MKHFEPLRPCTPVALWLGLLCLHPVLWSVIALDELGYPIFPLRQVLCLGYIIVVPGITALGMFNIRPLDSIQTVVFSIGLSISALLLISAAYYYAVPYFGVWLPPVWTVVVLSVCVVPWIVMLLRRERKGRHDGRILPPPGNCSEKVILMVTFPVLAIIGTYLMNTYDSNIILLLLLFSIPAVFLVFMGRDTLGSDLYPYAIVSMALALVLHQALISAYLAGWDIHREYYFANLVLQNAVWDPAIQHNINAMLSIVSLGPFIANFCNIHLVWVLKAVYPLLFSFVPVGLYYAYKTQTNEKIAFMACFFFISFSAFYTEMIQLARQQIAELFFMLIIVLVVSGNIQIRKRMLLITIFSASLIVSHYGLSYIYLLLLLPVWATIIILEHTGVVQFISRYAPRIHGSIALHGENNPTPHTPRVIRIQYVAFYSLFLIGWYFLVSEASCLINALEIGRHIFSTLFTELFNPESAEGMRIISSASATLLHSLSKYLHFMFQGCITLGLFAVVLYRKQWNFKPEFLVFSLFSLLVNIMIIAVPYFAYQLNATRLYHISQFFLSPFCVIGGLLIVTFALQRMPNMPYVSQKTAYVVISGLLAVYFLFNSGFFYEMALRSSSSIALDDQLDYPVFNEQEVQSALWISENLPQYDVYADEYRRLLLHGYLGIDSQYLHLTENGPPVDSFVFLGEYNLQEKQVLITPPAPVAVSKQYYSLETVIENPRWDKIYDNGGAEVRRMIVE
ncbi:MAG: DUF2206 domain-containing protein [Methanomicrobiaceae archaeon]|nr:DUF2206 domain-containing protein [Methanomicrobiaceae archaeon]